MKLKHKANVTFYILWSLGLLWVAACAPDQINVIDKGDRPADTSEIEVLLQSPSRIGFAAVNRLVFESSCNGCHNSAKASGGLDLSNYESIIQSDIPNLLMLGEPMESRLYSSLEAEMGSRRMPPEPKALLPEAQRQLVYEWIARGAPEKGGERQAFLSLEEKLAPFFENPETIDYEVVQQWVFKPGRCYECHSQQGYRSNQTAMVFGTNMSSYSSLFYLNGIVRGQPLNLHDSDSGYLVAKGSRIYEAVAESQTMPPKEEGFLPLSETRVKLLRLWILNCAIQDFDPSASESLLNVGEGAEKVRRCY